MSPEQLTAILCAIGGAAGVIGGCIKWAVGRITKALDDNTASNVADANAKVMLAQEMAVLSDRINRVSDFVQEHTPVNQPIPRRNTPMRGTAYHIRPKTRGDGE